MQKQEYPRLNEEEEVSDEAMKDGNIIYTNIVRVMMIAYREHNCTQQQAIGYAVGQLNKVTVGMCMYVLRTQQEIWS